MYATWPCPMPDGGTGEEMVMGFDKGRERRVLFVAPLFEEANKFRHQLAEIMRRLDALGIDSFLPDLPGCNESLALHSEQTIAHWRGCAAAAFEHVSATNVLAVRSGCWLVPEAASGWLYAPSKPKQVLRGLVRSRMLSAKEAGRDESADAILDRARSEGVELAGWALGPQLVSELENAEFAPPAGYTVIEQADVGGKPLWLRAENDHDPEQAEAIAAIIAGTAE